MESKPRLHQDSDQIAGRLAQEGISRLYHFTCIENLPLIMSQGALLCKQDLEAVGVWPVPEPGGNQLSHDLDRHAGNWDKVGLNFTPRTPMIYGKKRSAHLCFFVVDPKVATYDGVVFTDTNAAATNHNREQGLAGLDLVGFDAVKSRPRPGDREGWHRPVQAEVLVPGSIGLFDVLELAFPSQASMEEGERLCGNTPGLSFRVDRGMFADFPVSNPPLGFPSLANILLTDKHVDGTTVGPQLTSKSLFARNAGGEITAVADVEAFHGTKGSIQFDDREPEETTFEQRIRYWHWDSVQCGLLQPGTHVVTYRLSGIRWATVPFQVA